MLRTYLLIVLVLTNLWSISTIIDHRSKIIDLRSEALAIEEELTDTKYALNLLTEGIRIENEHNQE